MACGFCGQVRGAIRGIIAAPMRAWRPPASGGATAAKLTAGTPVYTGIKQAAGEPRERVLRRSVTVKLK